MLASQPKQLVKHNGTLNWRDYDISFAGEQMVQVSADSTIIVTCSICEIIHLYFTLSVWDSSTLQLIGQIENIKDDQILGIQISPNNKWIMYYTFHHVKVFDTYIPNNPPILEYQILYGQYVTPIFTSDSKYIIIGDNPMMMLNIIDKSQKPIAIKCGNADVKSIQCGTNILICATDDHRIQVWNNYSHMNVHSWLSKGRVYNLSLSNTQKLVVTIGRGDSIKLWSTSTKKLIRKYGNCSDAYSGHVDMSLNGQLIISNRCYEDCLLFYVFSGECITFEEACGMQVEYNFTSDGKHIIRSKFVGQRAKIWNIDCDSYFCVFKGKK